MVGSAWVVRVWGDCLSLSIANCCGHCTRNSAVVPRQFCPSGHSEDRGHKTVQVYTFSSSLHREFHAPIPSISPTLCKTLVPLELVALLEALKRETSGHSAIHSDGKEIANGH